jgi:hypothetical protein
MRRYLHFAAAALIATMLTVLPASAAMASGVDWCGIASCSERQP